MEDQWTKLVQETLPKNYRNFLMGYQQDNAFNYEQPDNRRVEQPESTQKFKIEIHTTVNGAKKQKQNRSRTVYTSAQILLLEEEYKTHKYVESKRRKWLSETLDVTEKQISSWFQNKRNKEKKQFNSCTYSNNGMILEL